MFNPAWLAQEARSVHDVFQGLFYSLILTFLAIGIVTEFFKWPLTGFPTFSELVFRAMLATFILHAYPEITAFISEFIESIVQQLGGFNRFDLVLAKMSDKLGEMTASWVSVKETMIMAFSFLSFFILYFSVYIAQGAFLFAWTLCYVFSPLLIALFVLPVTAGATKSLFKSLIEISLWKIVWSVLATLLWSSALNHMNSQQADVNFISVIAMNLFLASSVLLTPWVVHAFAGGSLAGVARNIGAISVGGSAISPLGALKKKVGGGK